MTSDKPQTFPIMHGDHLRSIPLSLIAPHEPQADRNHGQTLRRLAERGGLSPCEAMAVIRDRQWREYPYAEAELCVLVGRNLAASIKNKGEGRQPETGQIYDPKYGAAP